MTGPTKLTPTRHKAFVEAMGKGHFQETAAALIKVNRSTLHDWLVRGREDLANDPEASTIHANLVRDMEHAVAQFEAKGIGQIVEAGYEDWKALAWYFERRHQTRWGGKAAVEVNVRDTTVIVHASPEKPPELPE